LLTIGVTKKNLLSKREVTHFSQPVFLKKGVFKNDFWTFFFFGAVGNSPLCLKLGVVAFQKVLFRVLPPNSAFGPKLVAQPSFLWGKKFRCPVGRRPNCKKRAPHGVQKRCARGLKKQCFGAPPFLKGVPGL